ncbi:MAG TPA: zinc-binding dehydrogenase [Candidatus Competibacteraceae bacterium]|nr:zinc-binding dehydrogenase [Candidatus Competibacteraceae bacterium]
MRAVYIQSHGQPDSIVIGERPTPEPGPGEVRVRIVAAAFNHVDLYMRDSGAGITHELPLILGVDGTGIVDTVGPGVIDLGPGDRVVLYPARYCNFCEFCLRGDQMLCLGCKLIGEHSDGTFAEYVCMPAQNVHRIPEGLSFEAAAVLPTAYLTAWRMVMTQARVRPTETVLIQGVGGGVALAALQFAKLAGARVIATSSSDAKLESARKLGADAGVNYRNQDVLEQVLSFTGGRGVDVVIESVGESTWPTSLRALRRGGRIVTCGATTGPNPKADLQRVFIRQLQIIGSTLGNQDEFRALLLAAQHKQFAPVIDKIFPFDQAREALSYLEQARQFGKLVLRVSD